MLHSVSFTEAVFIMDSFIIGKLAEKLLATGSSPK